MKSVSLSLIGPVSLIVIVPFAVWNLYNGTYPAWQAFRASFLMGLAVLLAIGLFSWLLRSLPKAWLVVTLLVCVVLTQYISATVILMLIGILALIAFADRAQAHRNLSLATSIIGLVLLSGAAWPVLRATLEDRSLVTSHEALGAITLLKKPSIIHVVLDGYGAPDILSDIYGHDSERFLTALEKRGFLVVRDATTPYSQTLPAMASVMSGGIVDVGSRADPHVLRRDLAYTISNGPVVSVLREAGYAMMRNRSGYGYLDHSGATEVSADGIGLTELEAMLVPGDGDAFGNVHNRILKASMEPDLLDNLEEPFFYYQHLLAPHPPFSLNADGSSRAVTTKSYSDGSHALPTLPNGREDYIEGYRQKAVYIENALLRQIDSYPSGPKIVLIHGDHGPAAFLDHESANRTCMSERLRTFMAFYSNVPGVSFEHLVQADRPMSTINAYREIFDLLSMGDISRRPARSYYLSWSEPTKALEIAPEDLRHECN